LASITHVPIAVNDTTPALSEHPVELASREMVTGSPDVAVAVGVYVAPPTAAFPGAVLVKVMLCEAGPTLTDNKAGVELVVVVPI
jgi:hypothetical protein